MDVNGIGAVVTGGASGLGRATAEALIAGGAKITIFDVNEEVGTQAAAEMGCVFAKVDVTNEDDIRAGLDKGAAEAQGISVEEAKTNRNATIPAGRYGTIEEFGATCAFMCSQHAGYMIGQNILLDGGATNSTM